MNIEDIVKYLQFKMGMNPDSVGHGTMKKAIYTAMHEKKIDNIDCYYQLIDNEPEVLQALIDGVIIPETSFFRDKNPFISLKEHLAGFKSRLCEFDEPLKILSIPSSTGEEPYSIAMTCLEAGLKHSEFEIHAYDISQRVLDIAQKGIFSEYSFRGCDPLYKSRYFSYQDEQYKIDENLQNTVSFFLGNLISEGFVTQVAQRYHIVFCRNLLIYFDRPTKRKAIGVVSLLLHDDGLLVVGHADTAILPSLGYKSFSQRFSFAYVKSDSEHKECEREQYSIIQRGKELIESLSAVRKSTSMALSPPPPLPAVIDKGEVADRDTYQKIEELISEKKFKEAKNLCYQQLMGMGSEGVIEHYLGSISFHQGEMVEAEVHFKKAIYLQPNDAIALHFLANIRHLCGDKLASLRYEQRAERIKARNHQNGQ